jgi:hypothetical protein
MDQTLKALFDLVGLSKAGEINAVNLFSQRLQIDFTVSETVGVGNEGLDIFLGNVQLTQFFFEILTAF